MANEGHSDDVSLGTEAPFRVLGVMSMLACWLTRAFGGLTDCGWVGHR